MIKETLKFLREYYRIPRNKKICWGIIEEISASGTEYRLGVDVRGTNLFLDVALRRFYSKVQLRSVSRKIYPAVRRSFDKLHYEFVAENGLRITRSKTFITDIYYPVLYSRQLEQEGAL
ncbi:MAG: hypothetical protein IJ479_01680 [Alphaproteobacteria bacterium]|nr:hypothetical protein [Alphaproteobacteria bacterium]